MRVGCHWQLVASHPHCITERTLVRSILIVVFDPHSRPTTDIRQRNVNVVRAIIHGDTMRGIATYDVITKLVQYSTGSPALIEH
jgi:hypothetical protein